MCVCFSRVLTSTLLESLEYFRPFGGYFFFNTLLLVLQALHIFWAYLILRMVYKFVFMGKVRSKPIKVCHYQHRFSQLGLNLDVDHIPPAMFRWSVMSEVMRRVKKKMRMRKRKRRTSQKIMARSAGGSTKTVQSTQSWSRSRTTVS